MINMATWIQKRMKLKLKSHSVFYSPKRCLSKCFPLKFRYSEKASKVWNNLPLYFDVYLSNFQTKWEIFQIMWPSHNIWTLSLFWCFIMRYLVKSIWENNATSESYLPNCYYGRATKHHYFQRAKRNKHLSLGSRSY